MNFPMRYFFFLLFFLLQFLFSEAQPITPGVPDLPVKKFLLDSLPPSEINLPIQINLQPFYALAEKTVDTLFTSPNYPNAWVQEGCATRYKYSFRRGPLQFNFSNNQLRVAFTGYYKIIGSTRACVNGTVLSPWTPDCKCGFDEGERRVNLSFTITPVVLVNYVVKLQIARNEPVPVDKCTVCFWGQDITATVMDAIKKELDISKMQLEQKYGRMDFKPQFQKIWRQLNTPYHFQNMGWLQINPQKVRLNRLYGTGDQLNIHLGLSAKPVVRFEKPLNPLSTVPNISTFSRARGFDIYVEAVLNYDSLSRILNQQIAGKEFVFNKGFIRKKFIFQECKLMGSASDRLVVQIKFSGTDQGYFYVTGTPVYKPDKKIFAITNIEFDIKSKDALLKAAEWLFSGRITAEIEKMAQYDLSALLADTKEKMQQQLNQEFIKGVTGVGQISDVTVSQILPQAPWLQVRVNTKGDFSIKADLGSLGFGW